MNAVWPAPEAQARRRGLGQPHNVPTRISRYVARHAPRAVWWVITVICAGLAGLSLLVGSASMFPIWCLGLGLGVLGQAVAKMADDQRHNNQTQPACQCHTRTTSTARHQTAA